ncbi:MAG: four helix bundle protein, partial [Chitinophagaceae bacterium]
ATIKTFEDIESWQKAREVCKVLGDFIDENKFRKNFRLIHQIEGSSGSIMDNIAEGFERGTRAEFIQFLGYAKGSCGELRSQLYRALDRKYISLDEFETIKIMVMTISSLIQKFINYLLSSTVAGVRKKIAQSQL